MLVRRRGGKRRGESFTERPDTRDVEVLCKFCSDLGVAGLRA